MLIKKDIYVYKVLPFSKKVTSRIKKNFIQIEKKCKNACHKMYIYTNIKDNYIQEHSKRISY